MLEHARGGVAVFDKKLHGLLMKERKRVARGSPPFCPTTIPVKRVHDVLSVFAILKKEVKSRLIMVGDGPWIVERTGRIVDHITKNGIQLTNNR